MRIIRGLSNITDADRGVAVTLGNFDGVHLGHRALLDLLAACAPGVKRCVVCFEPQPLEFLRPDLAPVRLQSLSEKLRFLAEYGLDQVLVLRFDQSLAQMPAADFVRAVLIEGLAAKTVVVGDDWRFGYQRCGDIALLQSLSRDGGYQLEQLSTLAHGAKRVSSTRVREALIQGDMADVRRCLGRNFRIRGRVVHGQKLGRELGAATANVAMNYPEASPLRHGVYCVRLEGKPAVANIGIRPTISPVAGSSATQEHLEVHVLDGEHQLYDRVVCVEFEEFLRPEQKFADLQQLKVAIGQDVAQAKQHFEQEIV